LWFLVVFLVYKIREFKRNNKTFQEKKKEEKEEKKKNQLKQRRIRVSQYVRFQIIVVCLVSLYTFRGLHSIFFVCVFFLLSAVDRGDIIRVFVCILFVSQSYFHCS
jgi:predicted PurR-regulated permease PerM